MTNKERFTYEYNRCEKFHTNNNRRSLETIKGCENKLAAFLEVDSLLGFLKSISNDDEYDFVYKFTYDYFFKNERLNVEVEDEIVYLEHKSEREATSSNLRSEILAEANETCFFNCSNEMFLNQKEDIYLEVHHIIPLSYARKIGKKGDFRENLIAVCPTCHKRIHFEHSDSIIKQDMYKLMYSRVETSTNKMEISNFTEFYRKIVMNND